MSERIKWPVPNDYERPEPRRDEGVPYGSLLKISPANWAAIRNAVPGPLTDRQKAILDAFVTIEPWQV